MKEDRRALRMTSSLVLLISYRLERPRCLEDQSHYPIDLKIEGTCTHGTSVPPMVPAGS